MRMGVVKKQQKKVVRLTRLPHAHVHRPVTAHAKVTVLAARIVKLGTVITKQPVNVALTWRKRIVKNWFRLLPEFARILNMFLRKASLAQQPTDNPVPAEAACVKPP